MYKWLLSVAGAGFSPVAPGTCGSAVTAAVFCGAALLGLDGRGMLILLILIAVQGAVATIVYGQRFIDQYGQDPGPIVSDEQCGQAVTLFWLWHFTGGTVEIIAITFIGFFLFRLFDIIKPPPARQLESVPGAWGVLLDDVMAGVYAAVVLQLIVQSGWLAKLWS